MAKSCYACIWRSDTRQCDSTLARQYFMKKDGLSMNPEHYLMRGLFGDSRAEECPEHLTVSELPELIRQIREAKRRGTRASMLGVR